MADTAINPLPTQPRPLQQTTAAILAGGLGTRLRPVVGQQPKVLATVNERPFLPYLLDQLAPVGIQRVVLMTGYQADTVRRVLGDSHAGMSLLYSPEPTPLGTGGALRLALPRFSSSSILVLNGDSYCQVDLEKFQAFSSSQQAGIGMVLAHVDDTARFGRVDLSSRGLVRAFHEKAAVAGPGWINAGIYLCRRELIEEIPPDRPVSLESEMMPIWIRQQLVHGFCTEGAFLDIGTPASYACAGAFFDELRRQEWASAPSSARRIPTPV